jgi:LysM repeat protein
VDPGRRRELTRFGVPAAFLLAVTIAVLLIKAGLDNSDSQSTTVAGATTTTAPATRQPKTTTKLVLTGTPTTTTAPSNARYYVIQDGDTLGGIAGKYGTSVEQLLTFNPDLDPNALQPGTRIRVG